MQPARKTKMFGDGQRREHALSAREQHNAPARDFVGTDSDREHRFGSSHPAGVFAVFTDGSVRWYTRTAFA